jgi:hypothetical protein
MNVRRLLSVLVVLSGVSAARAALAVCMGAQEYRVSPIGSSYSIVPTNFQRRRCGDAAGLLRQNVDTGQVVKLNGLLPGAATGYCAGEGYLDECVPAGRYRYGLAVPYRCCPSCCTTQYYVQFTVVAPPPPNCEATRRPDNPPPVPFAGQVPWGASQEICDFVPPPDAGRPRPAEEDAGQPSGQPPGTGGTAPPGTSTGRGQNTGGCSLVGGNGAGGPSTVLALGGLGLLLAFVRRRARS